MNGHLKRVLILLLIFTFVFQMAGVTSLQRVAVYADDEVIDVTDADETGEVMTEETEERSPGEIETEGEEPPGADAEEAADPEAASEEPAEAPEETPDGEETVTVEEPAEAELPVVEETVEVKAEAKAAKAEKTGTVLAFTSDVHNGGKTKDNVAANRMETWINKVEDIHGAIDVFAFGGDMGSANYSGDTFWDLSEAAMDKVTAAGITQVHTTGNHEMSNGSFSSTSNSVKNYYTVGEKAIEGSDYIIYCLGSTGSNQQYTYTTAIDNDQVEKLTSFLDETDGSKPIFIITHFPLHSNGRTTTNASKVVDVLNDAADDGKTIVFLWGHNHTTGDSYYDHIYGPGESLPTDNGTQTIKFYYGAAGCMSDSEYGTGSESVLGKGLVVTINKNRGNATMGFTYYNADAEVVEEEGSVTSADITVRTTKTYTLTDTLEAGQEYIIASGNSGEVLLLSNESTGTAKQLKGVSATVSNNTITISDDVLSKVLFNCEEDSTSTLGGLQLESGGNYLYSSSNDGLSMHTKDAGRCWHYKAYDGDTDRHILWLIKESSGADGWTSAGDTYKYYLDYSSGTYFTDAHVENSGTIQGTSGLPKVYLYTEAPEGDTYTLSYDANGGTGSMTAQTNKTTYTVKTNSFTREGYEFTKWNTKADGTGTDYAPGDSITLTEDTTLFAQWTKATSVTYYVYTDTLTAGEKYLIVNANAAGSAHALSHSTTTVNDDTVTVKAGTTLTNNAVYIEANDVEATSVWTAGTSGTSFTFKNTQNGTDYYIYRSSGTLSASTSTYTWTWDSSAHTLRNSRYIRYSSGWSAGSSSANVYLYKETTISLNPTITLDNSTMTVGVGESDTLQATVLNAENYTVNWTSSDTSVAIVSGNGTNCTISGVAAGTANITANLIVDGEVVSTATCAVTVAVIEYVTYALADELVAGNQYLIVSGNSGNVLLLSNESTGTAKQLKGVNATVAANGTITIDSLTAEKVLFTSQSNSNSSQNGFWLKNGDQYLYADSDNGLRLVADSTQASSSNNAKSWHYKADNKNLLWFFKDTSSQNGYTDTSSTYKYYVDYSGNYFTDNHVSTTSLENSSTTAIYLFTLAVDYTLSYDANAADATGTTVDQTGSAKYTVSANGFTREGYVFQKWNTKADGTGTDYAPGDSITLNGNTTLYAQWQEVCTNHTYGEGQPVWTWTGNDTSGYTSATATFTCSVCNTVTTLTDSDIDVQTGEGGDCQTPIGATTYTAIVTLDGTDYQDIKSVGGSAPAKVTSVEANGEYVMAYYDGTKYYVIQQTGTDTPALTTLTALTSDTVTDNMLFVASATGSFTLKNKSTGRYIYSQSGTLTSNTSASGYYFSLNEAGSLVYTGRNSAYYYSIDSSGAFAAPTTDPGTGNLGLYILGTAQYGPHSYVFQGFTWTGNDTNGYTAAKADFKCSVCNAEQSVDAELSDPSITEATCILPGQTTITATVSSSNSLDQTEHSDSKTFTTVVTTTAVTYTPVTSLSANDFIIVVDGYAIASNSSSEIEAVQFDENSAPTNYMIWTASSSSNGYGFRNKGNTSSYLYENAGSNATGVVNTATSARSRWSYDSNKHLKYTPSTSGNSTVYLSGGSSSGFTVNSDSNEAAIVTFYTYGETTVTTPSEPLGHDWGTPVWAWTGSDAEGWTAATVTLTCTRDSSHTTTKTAEVTSETVGATTTYTATVTVDGQTFTDTKEVTAAHEHSYGEPVWSWADGYASATATFTCTSGDDTQTVTDSAPVETVVSAATCTADKVVKYTATVTFNGTEYTTTSENVTIANTATGHTYGQPEWAWADGYASATATFTCTSGDDTKTVTDNAPVDTVVSAATCTADKVVKYTATVTFNGTEYTKTTDNITVSDSALGHDWEFVNFTWTGNDEAGYTAAVANYKCKNDETHTQTVAATVTSATTAATCEEAGETVYTATVATTASLDGTAHSDAKTVAIPKLNHDWEFVDFTWAGNDEAGYTAAVANYKCKNDATHTQTVAATVTSATTAATCEEAGQTVYTATVAATASLDGAAKTDTKTVAIPKLDHDWEFVDFTWTGNDTDGYIAAVANYKCKNDAAHTQTVAATITPDTTAATCTTAGSTVYTAIVAEGASLDGVAHNDTKTVAIEALGHKWSTTPTWTWTGNDTNGYTAAKATFICENDATHKVEAEDTEIDVVAVDPTPTTAGSITYTASVTGPDNQTYTDRKVKTLTPTGYTFKEPVYTWTEATGGGYSCTALKECNEDQTQNITETVTAVPEVTTPATCETAGVRTYTATFAKIDFEAQTKTEVIPPLSHDWSEPAYTWAADYKSVTATRTCKNDASHVETETAAATGEITTAATCTTDGVKTWTSAAFENEAFTVQTTTETIPAINHDWNAPTYEWAADHTSVTATRTCKNNVSHTETETVAATGAVTTPATCTGTGVKTWTSAAFENAAFTVQTTTEAIPAINHDWNEPTYVWADDNSSVTATRTCKNDPAHIETETAAATGQVTTPATCTEQGVKVWTSAAFTNTAFEVQRKTETLPATNHNWSEPAYVWADDYSKVTATRTCQNDPAHVETDTATATGEVTKAATCTEPGVKTWTSAAFSNTAFTAQTTTEAIPATDHVWIEPAEWTWIGDEENGYTKVEGTFTCQNDSTHTQTVESTNITVRTVDPTPTQSGKTTYTAKVTGPDNVVYSIQKEIVIPPAGYTFKNPVYTWTETADGYSVTALKECKEDQAQNITETVTASYAVTTPAACEATGVGTYTAAFTNSAFTTQTKEVTIPATDHTVVTDEAVAPTCTETGLTAGSHCSVCNKVLTAQETVPATGHDWKQPTATWNADHTSAVLTFVCNTDASHTETVTASGSAIDSEITTQPTATTPGVRTYTATVTLDGKTYTVTATEAIPATGSTVSGNITSYVGKTEAGQVTVQLFAGDSTEPAYTATVTNNESYTIEGVAAGTYTMKVSKKDHVTRSYEITTDGTALTQDVKIHLLGDVNGDGKISMIDVGQANQHVREIKTLTGYEFDCADTNGDGKLTMIDVGQINQHVREIRYLW